uniref:Uncharacterized protein n=1 Tax=Rhizophora mucronata TaxID=61149 RepID=A0A2P2NVX7_RHIMU
MAIPNQQQEHVKSLICSLENYYARLISSTGCALNKLV